ncbi:MAG: hypothetical protein RLW87_12415 [Alphaproteobacteria bacterium]
MPDLSRILEKLDLVFDTPPSPPVQVQLLGRTLTAQDPLVLLPTFLSTVPPKDWPSWLRDSHWLWTGALNGRRDGVSIQKRRSDARYYRTTQPARAVMRVKGNLIQVQYLTYEAMFGPDDSPEGQYRQLKHDDDCPHDHCVNPLHWTPVQSPVRRKRSTDLHMPTFSAEQEMQELIELIEDKMALDRSQNFEEFWETHFSRGLFTQDEVRSAIRTIGGNVQRKLLGEDQHDGSCTT